MMDVVKIEMEAFGGLDAFKQDLLRVSHSADESMAEMLQDIVTWFTLACKLPDASVKADLVQHKDLIKEELEELKTLAEKRESPALDLLVKLYGLALDRLEGTAQLYFLLHFLLPAFTVLDMMPPVLSMIMEMAVVEAVGAAV